jgi:hypothetical protein
MDDLTGIERSLRAAGAPPEVPFELEAKAREAALGRDRPAEVLRLPSPERRRHPARSLLLAAAVLVGSAAAALLIGVGGSSTEVQRTLHLTGAGNASAVVDFAKPSGPNRAVVVKVNDLAPATGGAYYEMWMSDGQDTLAMVAFNTHSDGTATVDTTLPSGMGWHRCWVTREGSGSGGSSAPVLRSA